MNQIINCGYYYLIGVVIGFIEDDAALMKKAVNDEPAMVKIVFILVIVVVAVVDVKKKHK